MACLASTKTADIFMIQVEFLVYRKIKKSAFLHCTGYDRLKSSSIKIYICQELLKSVAHVLVQGLANTS